MDACDFTGARRIGAPRDWDHSLDGECGTIFVADAVDLQSGMPIMYSVYQPTAVELAELNAGGVIRLGIMGRSHPVFQLGVLSAETAKAADLRPVWSLGDVISGSTPVERDGGIRITTFGGNCPVQAEGTVDDVPFYFRARGAIWEIYVGPEADWFTEQCWHHHEDYGVWPEAGWMPDDVAHTCIAKGLTLWRQRERT